MDAPARAVSGLTPSAQALFVAAATQALPHGVVLSVVPSDGDLEQAVADVRFFASALEGLSELDSERTILPLPSHEVDPYRGLAPHFGVASARARAVARGSKPPTTGVSGLGAGALALGASARANTPTETALTSIGFGEGVACGRGSTGAGTGGSGSTRAI